jgi:hypothetical protein
MKNSHIIIENNLKNGHWNVIEWWYSIFFVQRILNFQKEINVIMYIIDFFLKSKPESFHLNKILIRYEISKFMFF